MANPQHLAILERGVEAWNRWRGENPDIRPDLTGGFFADRKLAGIQLQWANLHKARFLDSKLTSARLWDAKLWHADFSGSILAGADLNGADLSDADFVKADLTGVLLRGANLSRTRLLRADLTGAEVGWTKFSGINLAECVGLGSLKHKGASSVGIDTLVATGRHHAPERLLEIENFLEDAKVPAAYISFFLTSRETIQKVTVAADPVGEYYSPFISYSHTDREFARLLHDQLQGKGIRCWRDEKELRIGDEILPGVLDAIRLHDRVILCCSKTSLTSDWVATELEETFAKEEKEERPILLPLDLDGYLFSGWKGPLAVRVRRRLAADFTGWETDNAKFEEQFERVVAALRAGQ